METFEGRPSLLASDISEQLAHIAPNDRGEPLTWGATPLVITPEVLAQQAEVKNELSTLFRYKNTPDYITPRIAEYIDLLNTIRTVRRESLNTESYNCRAVTDITQLPPEILPVLERAEKGFASPAELLLLSRLLGIPTIELASLTHPYGGDRIKMLDPMRASTREGIVMMGGTLADDSVRPVYKVKGCDSPHDTQDMQTLHMTRDTLIGTIPDGSEDVERSSFVLLLDQIPTEYATAIREIPYGEFWANRVRRVHKLYEFVDDLLRNDQFEMAVPVSTTVVDVNGPLSAQLLTDEARQSRVQQYIQEHAIK